LFPFKTLAFTLNPLSVSSLLKLKRKRERGLKMSTQTRRSSFSSSTSSSLAKRHASSSSTENVGKATAVAPHLAKKRAPLGDITNQKNVTQKGSRTLIPSSTLVGCFFFLLFLVFVSSLFLNYEKHLMGFLYHFLLGISCCMRTFLGLLLFILVSPGRF